MKRYIIDEYDLRDLAENSVLLEVGEKSLDIDQLNRQISEILECYPYFEE